MYFVEPDAPDDIYHYGVKGMKWGVRKTRYEARRDAKKYVKAKMFYGEGAGNQRKLLNANLKPKMKDPLYKSFFDEAVANADTAAAARQARAKRGALDTKKKVKRVIRTAGPIAVGVGGVYYAAHREQIDRAVLNTMDRAVNEVRRRKTARQFRNWTVES